MKLTFLGAAREVTGSCYLLETKKSKILIDCGMFQGSFFSKKKNEDLFLFNPNEIDAVLLTHAHIDHSGRIPQLVKRGYGNDIFATKSTFDFTKLLWEDAYNIMVNDLKEYNRNLLFNKEDIKKTLTLEKSISYNKTIKITSDIQATWKDAGHIFGSAFIEIEAENKKIVFSGDIGNVDAPILKDTAKINKADYVICESTYGDRIHEKIEIRQKIILDLLKKGIYSGGTIMIPSFSLERTQELLYDLNQIIEYKKTLPPVPIFLDSPLAIKATRIYKKYPDNYDKEAKKLYKIGDDFLHFSNLKNTLTVNESKKINSIRGPKIIIAGSGMMNGGRIIHHAFRYLSDPKSTLLIIGYQADGTLGRRLYEGVKKVKIFNKEIKVNCQIKAIGALSAHGDQRKLINWVKSAGKDLKNVYCTHGDPNGVTTLAHRLEDTLGIECFVPEFGEETTL